MEALSRLRVPGEETEAQRGWAPVCWLSGRELQSPLVTRLCQLPGPRNAHPGSQLRPRGQASPCLFVDRALSEAGLWVCSVSVLWAQRCGRDRTARAGQKAGVFPLWPSRSAPPGALGDAARLLPEGTNCWTSWLPTFKARSHFPLKPRAGCAAWLPPAGVRLRGHRPGTGPALSAEIVLECLSAVLVSAPTLPAGWEGGYECGSHSYDHMAGTREPVAPGGGCLGYFRVHCLFTTIPSPRALEMSIFRVRSHRVRPGLRRGCLPGISRSHDA